MKLTPFGEWKKRGRYGLVRVVRRPDSLGPDVKINYSKFLGIPYDLSFRFNNGKYYCSELVYVIYRDQFGIRLCQPRPVKQYRLSNQIRQAMKKRNISDDQLVVAPCDLL